VKGPGDAGHEAFPDTPDVVGVDLQTDSIVLAAVDNEGGANTAERFGERDGCSPMQEAIRLPGAVIHRHAAFDEIFPDLREFHAEVFCHGIFAQRLDKGDSQILLKPDRHIC
jgi:hypothetical protein